MRKSVMLGFPTEFMASFLQLNGGGKDGGEREMGKG